MEGKRNPKSGLLLAPFTFGISIPTAVAICAVLGAAIDAATGPDIFFLTLYLVRRQLVCFWEWLGDICFNTEQPRGKEIPGFHVGVPTVQETNRQIKRMTVVFEVSSLVPKPSLVGLLELENFIQSSSSRSRRV